MPYPIWSLVLNLPSVATPTDEISCAGAVTDCSHYPNGQWADHSGADTTTTAVDYRCVRRPSVSSCCPRSQSALRGRRFRASVTRAPLASARRSYIGNGAVLPTLSRPATRYGSGGFGVVHRHSCRRSQLVTRSLAKTFTIYESVCGPIAWRAVPRCSPSGRSSTYITSVLKLYNVVGLDTFSVSPTCHRQKV